MLVRASLFGILLTLFLTGCGTSSHRNNYQAAIWPDMNSVVPPGPTFPIGAPIESNLPAPVKPVVPPPPKSFPRTTITETWVPLERWSKATDAAVLSQRATGPVPTFALQSTNGTFVLHTGSLLAQWEGLEVRLGFAPQLIDGHPYVHSLDLSKTIQPLLQGNPPLGPGSSPVIVIDPGHGGENPGTRCVLDNRLEKEFTLDWAQRLQAMLMANNYRIFLTRANDTDLALSNRVAFAAQHKADLFLSLHFNSAAPNEVEAGLETYCLTPAGMPSNLTRGFPDEIHQTFPNNAFDTQNLLLALQVHRALLEINGHRDRGIRRARFPGVLRGQQCAAILVEGGYLSNPQEARRIEDSGYRQKLAEAVAKALMFRPGPGAGMIASAASAAEHGHPTPPTANVQPAPTSQPDKPQAPTETLPKTETSSAPVSQAQSP